MRTVPVSLKWMNETSLHSTNGTLQSSLPFFTTKQCSEGKWYYELSHIDGDRHVNFGFSYENKIPSSFIIGANKDFSKYFYVYNYSSIQFFFSSNTAIVNETFVPNLGFNEHGFTVGVAYDTFSNIFSVYHNNSFEHFNIRCDNKKRVGPLFIEGTGGSTIFHDQISVNFGQKPFKYGLPLGYQPWNTIWKSSTCESKHFTHFSCLFSLIFLIVI